MLAGLAASTLPGRRSAAQRHRVLAVAILAAAAVVPLGLVLPAWELDLYATRAGGASAAPAAAVVGPVAVLGRTDTLTTLLLPFVPVVWVAGAAMWLAVLVAGLVRLRSLAGRARPVRDGRCRRLAAEIAAQFGLECPPTLLHSDEPALLATWGVLRPHVMLPSDAPDWSDERVRVVLCHELAHVRRNDWAVQLAAEARPAVVLVQSAAMARVRAAQT